MPDSAEADFDTLTTAEATERLACAVAKIKAEHARPTIKQARQGHGHSQRTKRRLSASMFQRRRAEALLNGPSEVARLRLAANLTQRSAADRAFINERSWHRAENRLDSVSAMTQRRIAHALGVAPDALR